MVNRIKKVVEYSKLSESAFAAKCGLVQNALWYQLNGKRKLSLETVSAVLNSFPEISAEWLLIGNGSMLNAENNAEHDKRLDNLIDVISMQQETIRNLQDKIKQLQNQ